MTTPNNPRDELRIEIIDWIDSVTCDVHQTKSDYEYCADQILFQVDTYVKGIIGEDIPIFVKGHQVKTGDVMQIDLSGGTGSAVFRESCRNIQDNGKNVLKAEQRQKAGLEDE